MSLRQKTVVETILVAITDSSDVRCFHLYLINITKSSWHFIVYLLLLKI